VIRSTGELGGYAWGPDRKRTMLALETSRGEMGDSESGRSSAVARLARATTPLVRTPAKPLAVPRASVAGARPVRSA